MLLKFFQLNGRFPRDAQEIPAAAIEHVAASVGVDPTAWSGYAWSGSTIEYHRAQVRKLLAFREATSADASALASWLSERVLLRERAIERVRQIALERYRELRLEPPTTGHLDRSLRSAIHNHEAAFCEGALKHLSAESRAALDRLLLPLPGSSGLDPDGPAPLHYIASDPGRAGLRSIEEHVAKLAAVHRIGARAEQRVENELLEDLRRVAGKTAILFRVAEAALAHPDDTVRTVVYPVVHEDTLLALVKEARASGSAYRR